MRRALQGLRAWAHDILLRRSADHDMDEELRFHIDMETEKYVQQGVEPAEARRRALMAFGGIERHRDRLREGRRVPLLEPLWHDVRFGLRALARTPGLSLVAVATIGLGVGATTTVFSTLHALLLRPLPIPGVDRLVNIQETRNGNVSSGIEGVRIPFDRYEAYRDRTAEVFSSLAGQRLVDAFSLRLPDVTVAVGGVLTTGNYFQTLGIRLALGRAYASADADEIVISHDLWVSRFGADPGVLGRSVPLDGHTVVVVGVTPQGFGGTNFVASDVWAPVGLRGRSHTGWAFRVVPVGRLRDGVSLAQASAVVAGLAKSIEPEQGTTVLSAILDPVTAVPGEVRGYLKGFMALLLGTALLVLLIAATNIAAIMLARGLTRGRELAVRLAIGAGRARIVRHLMAESLLLFAAGGLLGIALACGGTLWLSRIPLPPQVPPLIFRLTPDATVLAFAAAVTGLTGVLFGLLPAVGSSRTDIVSGLKTGPAATGGRGGWMGSAFVSGQLALAVTLLLTATLFARSLLMGLSSDIGFDPDGVVAATISQARAAPEGRDFQTQLLQRARELPGVQDAAWSTVMPLSGDRNSGDVRRTDAPDVPGTNATYTVVSPQYFRTMRIRIVAGRGFTPDDAEGAPRVVVINSTLAERLWPGQSPLGHRLVGVVGDAVVIGVTPAGRYAFINENPAAAVYLSSLQVYQPSMALEVRAPGAEAATLDALYRVLHGMDPELALQTPVRVKDLVGTGILPQRLAAQLVGAFGLVGLLLAALGVYGVLAYQVARRTRDIGVRRALGATAGHVVAGVVKRGAALAVAGCLVGGLAGAGLAEAAHSFLYGIRPLDPFTFTAVPAILVAVALLASLVPAARASSVEASEALKTD